MNKTWAACLVALVAALPSSPADATSNPTYECVGTVSALALNGSGVLTVSVTNSTGTWMEHDYLCSIGFTMNSISPEVCKGIYGLLLTAATTNKTVKFLFNDGPSSCPTPTSTLHPAWSNLTYDTGSGGWYYGPEIVP